MSQKRRDNRSHHKSNGILVRPFHVRRQSKAPRVVFPRQLVTAT